MSIGYVYFIMAMGENKFKIGKSKILPKRFSGIDTASPCELMLFGVVKSEKYEEIEKRIHYQYDNRRIRKANGNKKEWFRLTKAEAIFIIEKYHGFYTAPTVYDDHEITKAILKMRLDKILSLVEKIFPTVKPNRIILASALIAIPLFQILLPAMFRSSMAMSTIMIMASNVFLLASFVVYSKKFLRLMYIIAALIFRYFNFDNIYFAVSSEVSDKFLASALAITVFIVTPMVFYGLVARLSLLLDEVPVKSLTASGINE